MQGAFRRLRLDGNRYGFRCLDGAAWRVHHGLDLGNFVGNGLACTLGGFRFVSGFLGGNSSGSRFLLRFFSGSSFLRFGGGIVNDRRSGAGGRRGGSLGGRFLRFCFSFFLRSQFSLLRGFRLGFFFRVELGQTFLLFAQIGFLAGDQLSLFTGFFFTARHVGGIDHRCGRRDRFCRDRRSFVTLDESAFLAHFHLDGARFAGGVSLLDLSRFLAGHGDFFLFCVSRCAVCAAQMIQKLVLIIFRQWI
ncbi:hypothetical protein D3C85_409150 [compost metagenome]